MAASVGGWASRPRGTGLCRPPSSWCSSRSSRRTSSRARYGFRPKRRAQDAIAEIHFFTTRSYEWVVEGDIKACFDEISHSVLWTGCGPESETSGVLGLVKAFLKVWHPR